VISTDFLSSVYKATPFIFETIFILSLLKMGKHVGKPLNLKIAQETKTLVALRFS
jgi:hypothetical protein